MVSAPGALTDLLGHLGGGLDGDLGAALLGHLLAVLLGNLKVKIRLESRPYFISKKSRANEIWLFSLLLECSTFCLASVLTPLLTISHR